MLVRREGGVEVAWRWRGGSFGVAWGWSGRVELVERGAGRLAQGFAFLARGAGGAPQG